MSNYITKKTKKKKLFWGVVRQTKKGGRTTRKRKRKERESAQTQPLGYFLFMTIMKTCILRSKINRKNNVLPCKKKKRKKKKKKKRKNSFFFLNNFNLQNEQVFKKRKISRGACSQNPSFSFFFYNIIQKQTPPSSSKPSIKTIITIKTIIITIISIISSKSTQNYSKLFHIKLNIIIPRPSPKPSLFPLPHHHLPPYLPPPKKRRIHSNRIM